MNFINWIIDLKLRHFDSKKRVKYLVQRLIKEFEEMGYETGQYGCKFVAIFEHDTYFSIGNADGRLTIIK